MDGAPGANVRRRSRSSGRLTCRVIGSVDELQSLAAAWEALLACSEFPDVFVSPGFALAWWKAYGADKQLRVVSVEDGDGLRLVAPFYEDCATPGVWSLLGASRADYGNLVHAAADRASVAVLFDWLGRRTDWRMIRLRRVPGDALVLKHLTWAYGEDSPPLARWRGRLALHRPLAHVRWHREHPWIDRAGIGRLGTSIETSENLLRRLRLCARRGTLDYRRLTEPAACARWLDRFMALHIRSFEARGKTSLFTNSEARAFYAGLVDELGPRNGVRLDLLLLDDTLVAAHFGFQWANRAYYYKPCFDTDYAKESPGTLLLAFMLRDASEQGLEAFDLLKGAEAYKSTYATGVRLTASVEIYRSRIDKLRRWLSPRPAEQPVQVA